MHCNLMMRPTLDVIRDLRGSILERIYNKFQIMFHTNPKVLFMNKWELRAIQSNIISLRWLLHNKNKDSISHRVLRAIKIAKIMDFIFYI